MKISIFVHVITNRFLDNNNDTKRTWIFFHSEFINMPDAGRND